MNTPRPVPGFPGYTICPKGVIRRMERTIETRQGERRRYGERTVCHQKHKNGIAVTLYDENGKGYWVSVAPVLLAVWGTEPKPDSDLPLYCAHKDSDVHSLELSNLTWLSRGKIKQTANQNGRRK